MWMVMSNQMWCTITRLSSYLHGPSLINKHKAWTMENEEMNEPLVSGQILVVWFHDESTFYMNDQCIVCLVHKGEMAVLCTKGEGASLMVAKFHICRLWMT
jgi:hypothetical protein